MIEASRARLDFLKVGRYGFEMLQGGGQLLVGMRGELSDSLEEVRCVLGLEK